MAQQFNVLAQATKTSTQTDRTKDQTSFTDAIEKIKTDFKGERDGFARAAAAGAPPTGSTSW